MRFNHAAPIALVALVFLTSGCTTREIHQNIHADKSVLTRQWVIRSGLIWDSATKGGEFSNPLLIDNTLVFANQTQGVVSVYPGLNLVRWRLSIEGGVMSEMLANGPYLYFGAADGNLYRVRWDNGAVEWKYALRNTVVSQPTVSEGRLFVTTADDTVYAFDAGTGEWLWHYSRRSAQTASVLGASKPLVDGGEVIAGLSDGTLVGLSEQEGKLKWEKQLHTGRKFTDIDAHPVLFKGTLYVPAYDGSLYALDRTSLQIMWKFDAGASREILVDEGKIYLSSSDGHVYCLQRDSGKLLWSFELDDGVPTPIVLARDLIVLGSSHQYLYALDRVTGEPLYRTSMGDGSGFYSRPIYHPETASIYAMSASGNVYSFGLRTPRKRKFLMGSSDSYEFFYR